MTGIIQNLVMACPSHAHQNLCRKNVTTCMF
jgi:hypothetical protein